MKKILFALAFLLVPRLAAADPITSAFESLPANGPYTDACSALEQFGRPLPAESCSTISRADMELHLQTIAGNELASEIESDPACMGYGNFSRSDQQLADLVSNSYRKRLEGSACAGYTGLTILALVVTTATSLGSLDATSFRLEFDPHTPTSGLQGQRRTISSNTSGTITIASAFPALIGLTDRAYIVYAGLDGSRLNKAWTGLPYAPNVVTDADVAAALQ